MNWHIFAVAIWFWLIETRYFGWNFAPASPAEVICDGIVLAIVALGIASKRRALDHVEIAIKQEVVGVKE